MHTFCSERWACDQPKLSLFAGRPKAGRPRGTPLEDYGSRVGGQKFLKFAEVCSIIIYWNILGVPQTELMEFPAPKV